MASHTCNLCGHFGPWDSGWNWYGSIKEEEEGRAVKMCSPTCQDAFRKAGEPSLSTLERRPHLVQQKLRVQLATHPATPTKEK